MMEMVADRSITAETLKDSLPVVRHLETLELHPVRSTGTWKHERRMLIGTHEKMRFNQHSTLAPPGRRAVTVVR